MTMQFSAYQIESMLDDFQQENFPSDRLVSENLSLSKEAITEARQHFNSSEDRSLISKSTKEIIELIEDKNEYDPVVDFVQQSRAGRFVDPIYIPENSPPGFSLVTDFSKHERKYPEEEQKSRENEFNEKEFSLLSMGNGISQVKDKVSLNESENEKFLSHPEQMNIPITKKGSYANFSKIRKTEILEVVEEETISENMSENTKDLTELKKKMPTDSAAKLFEGIEDVELNEEFEFDEKELHVEDEADNDVVFGDGQIDSKSISRFVKSFPDSAIKFLFRKNLDGRNLPIEYERIYINWEKRGLSRGRLKKYLYKLMQWDNFPDIPILEVLQRIKDRQYDLNKK